MARRQSQRTSVRTVPPEAAGTDRWTVVAIVGLPLLALVLRLVYLVQIRDVPFFEGLYVDARAYWDWAGQIAGGDWIGKETFYQAPLYPYVLAILRLLTGSSYIGVRVGQAVMGSAACVFLFLAGRAFVGRPAGAVAGLLLAIYPPAIFFDGLIQKATLGLLLTTWMLWMLGRCHRRPTFGTWLLVGVSLGLLCLTRENALALIVVIALWLFVHFARHGLKARLRWCGAFVAGLAVTLMPVGFRNLAVGGEFLLTTSQFGPNFFIGNNSQASGAYIALRGSRGSTQFERTDAIELAERDVGRSLTPKEVSAYWTERAMRFIRTQPGKWLALMGRKWLLTWNAFEIADAEDLYLYASWSSLLAALGLVLHFGVIGPVAAGGIVLTWRRWRDLWLLYALLLTFATAVTLFFVFARYRFPLVPVLLIFAGAGVVEGVARIRAKRWRPLGVAVVAVVVAAVVMNWPIFNAAQQKAVAHYNLGTALADREQYAEAIHEFRKSLAYDASQSATHNNLANTLRMMHRPQEAMDEYQEAVRLQPQNAAARFDYATFLMQQGKYADALTQFRESQRYDPDYPEVYLQQTLCLLQFDRFAEAIGVLREGRAALPDDVRIMNSLAQLLSTAPRAADRNGAEAVQLAETAARMTQFKDPRVLDTLAAAYAEVGRFDDAVKAARRGLQLAHQAGEQQMAAILDAHRRLFEAHKPFHIRPAPPQQ